MEGWLCDKFHCRPSELDEEDGPRLLLLAELQTVYDVMHKLSREGPKGLTADEHRIVKRIMEDEAERGGNG